MTLRHQSRFLSMPCWGGSAEPIAKRNPKALPPRGEGLGWGVPFLGADGGDGRLCYSDYEMRGLGESLCAPPACGGAGERSETEGEIVTKYSACRDTPSALRAPPPQAEGGQSPYAIAMGEERSAPC
jgi:hypothetical protein